jgi:hypothetical protein
VNVILEGPDGSGKTTLANKLSGILGMNLQLSQGPPKFDGEIHERLAKYAKLERTIFDRHPVVSQTIYGHFRGPGPDIPTTEEVNQLYASKPLIIYCRASDLSHHKAEAHDTREHLDMVERKHQEIIQLYDRWAVEYAHMCYRIGDRERPLVAAIESYVYGPWG